MKLHPATLADCALEAEAIDHGTKYRVRLRHAQGALHFDAMSVYSASEDKGFPLPENLGDVLPLLAGLALSDINQRIAEFNAGEPSPEPKEHHGNL